MLGRVRSCKIASTKVYFHHSNKKKTEKKKKKSDFTKQQRAVKITDNLQTVQNKINMGMLTTLANAVWLMIQTVEMKITHRR